MNKYYRHINNNFTVVRITESETKIDSSCIGQSRRDKNQLGHFIYKHCPEDVSLLADLAGIINKMKNMKFCGGGRCVDKQYGKFTSVKYLFYIGLLTNSHDN